MYLSSECAAKSNKWAGRNITRWRDAEYDKRYAAAQVELDLAKRAALFIAMNDMVVAGYEVPLLHRANVAAVNTKLRVPGSGWDNDLWALPDWWRDTSS